MKKIPKKFFEVPPKKNQFPFFESRAAQNFMAWHDSLFFGTPMHNPALKGSERLILFDKLENQ